MSRLVNVRGWAGRCAVQVRLLHSPVSWGMTILKTFTFGIRETPRGAVAWMQPPSGNLREKRFRNGYSGAKISAQKWIDEQIGVLQEYKETNPHSDDYMVVETHKQQAGYKPSPAGTTKVPMTIRVEPELREYLRTCENATEAIGQALRRTKDFREWINGKRNS